MALKKSCVLFCLELQRQVDQYFMSMVLQRDIHIDVSTKDYPKIYLKVSTETQEVHVVEWYGARLVLFLQAANATIFLFCGITFQVCKLAFHMHNVCTDNTHTHTTTTIIFMFKML